MGQRYCSVASVPDKLAGPLVGPEDIASGLRWTALGYQRSFALAGL